MSLGLSIQYEAMDDARSTPQAANYHADIISLLHLLGMKEEHGVDDTPRQAYTSSVPGQHSLDTVGQHTFVFYGKYAMPVVVDRLYQAIKAIK